MSTSALQLSVIDQSPVVEGYTAAQAVQHSIQLVSALDALGYKRYWFAEHHGSASFASASPVAMMAHAAARTTNIRIGSGGILLGNTSALQIAEQVRTLAALAPGRVDAGFGRAPGGDARVMQMLQRSGKDGFDVLREVLALLADTSMPRNQGAVTAVPDGIGADVAPEVWLLGTSPQSAVVAGRMGLRYAFGAFIDPRSANEALALYHQEFVPSAHCAHPYTMYAGVVFCAETDAAAHALAACSEHWFVESFLRNMNVRFPAAGTPPPALNDMERMLLEFRRESVLIGDAARVADGLHRWQRTYAANEIAMVTITDSYESRLKSYELVMERSR